jgi:hypothetical protein
VSRPHLQGEIGGAAWRGPSSPPSWAPAVRSRGQAGGRRGRSRGHTREGGRASAMGTWVAALRRPARALARRISDSKARRQPRRHAEPPNTRPRSESIQNWLPIGYQAKRTIPIRDDLVDLAVLHDVAELARPRCPGCRRFLPCSHFVIDRSSVQVRSSAPAFNHFQDAFSPVARLVTKGRPGPSVRAVALRKACEPHAVAGSRRRSPSGIGGSPKCTWSLLASACARSTPERVGSGSTAAASPDHSQALAITRSALQPSRRGPLET